MNLNLKKLLDYKAIKWVPLLMVIPVTVITFFSYFSMIDSFENYLNKELHNAARAVSEQIDTFLDTNKTNMTNEASIPELITYLQNQRHPSSDSQQNSESQVSTSDILALLKAFQIKNQPFATSYALVSDKGKVLIDTDSKNLIRNESKYTYFKTVSTLKMAIVDDIRFTNDNDSYFIFAVPILDSQHRLVGVLRSKYSPSILQKFIDSNYASLGKRSHAILYDDNFLKLADGLDPANALTLGVNLADYKLEQLRSQHRIPISTFLSISTDSEIPSIIQNSNMNLFDTFSKLNSEKKGSFKQYSQMVIKTHEKNWYVVYLQPRLQWQNTLYKQTYILMFVLILAVVLMSIIALFVVELFTSLQKRELELSIVQNELRNMLDKEREWNKEIETDLILGRNIQKAIQAIPELPSNLKILTHQDVAQYVSGDSYFVNWDSSSKRLTFFLQDIVGHGVQAALKASISHQIAKTIWNQSGIEKRLETYDSQLQSFFDNLDQKTSDFNALAGAEFDLNSNTLNVYRSNYGAPFLIKPSSSMYSDSTREELKSISLELSPLAIKHKTEYQCNLEPGSILIVVSDGYLYNSRAEVSLFKYLKSCIQDQDFILNKDSYKYILAINSWFKSLDNPPLDDRSIILFQWLPSKKDSLGLNIPA